jgi:propanol-preferring alcohol dehydrogenase
MTRSRAVVLAEHNVEPRVVDRPVPSPGPGQVRIAMRACGICGSHLHIIDGSTVPAHLPIVLGHEASGMVDALGDGVTRVQIDDRVAVNPMIGCGTCRPCVTRRANLCSAITVMGLATDGAHADFFLAPEANVVPLPDSVGFPLGAIAADALATPLHVIDRARVMRMWCRGTELTAAAWDASPCIGASVPWVTMW